MTAPRAIPTGRILTLRLHAGQTQRATAQTIGVSQTTYRAWESGTSTPHPSRWQTLASALGVPVASLLAPDGWVVVRELRLQPSTVQRVRQLGRPEAERVAALLSAGLVDDVFAACRAPKPSRGARAKPRRTRAEVLASIEASRVKRAGRQPDPG